MADVLTASGWTVLARNWRGGGHELDMVASRDGALRFVEVKARAPDDPSLDEAIDGEKQRRLRKAAEAWLFERGDAPDVAFLVALVTFPADQAPSVQWIDDAF